ncbi:MAG: pyridoxal phosphate-dependent aminotransferase [Candidatus Bathyarchaeia archaeon]
MGIGEPDFIPPPHILEAAKRALDEGRTHYTATTGVPELREALVEKAMRDYGLSYDPGSEVLVTAGGTEAIFLALLALINPDDEILIPDPGFVCYEPGVLMAGGIPVSMPILEKDSFRLDADVVMSLITDRSRVMIINTPNNPTGSVLSYDDIAELAKLAVERDLIVISDEVYEKITYDDAKHHCLATFPKMRERTIVINSFSKTYAMTGFRVGYAFGPKKLISPMMLAHQYITACVNGPAQYAAVAALEGLQKFVGDMVTEFDRRRRLLHSRLNEITGFSCLLPKGAFYAFVNIEEFGESSEKFSEHLLKKEKVVTVPGSAFGRYGEGYLRFSYATAYEKIEEALDRIEKIAGEFS